MSATVSDVLSLLQAGKTLTLEFPSEAEFSSFRTLIYREKKKFDRCSLLLDLPVQVLRIDMLEAAEGKVKVKLLLADKRRVAPKMAKKHFDFVIIEEILEAETVA